MAVSEKLQFIIAANADGAIRAFQQVGNTADKELSKAESKLDKLGGRMTKFGAGAVAASGVAAVALFKVGQSASDLEESINAVNVTFGTAADGVLALGESAAKSVGLSKTEFNGLAVQFSSFATTIAGAGGDVVGTLDDMTVRAADFASVMNLDVPEAARVFQSALAGETEPIKKFGIDLSAASVAAYAVAKGISESAQSMTEAEKVQARYGLLMEQTAKTAGDFANTSDGAANQQRILTAELKNLTAGIGQGVLPVMTTLVSTARSVVQTFTDLPDPIQKTVGTLATFGTGALAVGGSLSFIIGQTIKMRNAFTTVDADGVRSMTRLSKGVLGASAAIGAAALVYDAYNDDKRAAEKVTQDFTEALAAEKDGQDGAVRALLARQLVENKVFTIAEKLGVTQRQLADSITGKTVPALDAVRAKLEEVESSGLALDQRNRAMEESFGISATAASVLFDEVDKLAKGHSSAVEFTNDLTRAEQALKDGTKAGAEEARAAALERHGLADGIRDATESVEDSEEALKAEEEALNKQKDATKRALDRVKEHAEAERERAIAVEEGRQKLVDSASSIYSLEKANIELEQSIVDLDVRQTETAKLLADGKVGADEKAAALRELRLAQIATGEEALALAQKFDEEHNKGNDARLSAQLQKEELERLKVKFPQLTEQINAYIAALSRVPSRVTTTVTTITGSGRTAPVVAMHGGGSFSAGQPMLVGDNPDGTPNATSEIIVPSTSGTVIPASQTQRLLGGGDTFHLYGIGWDTSSLQRMYMNAGRLRTVRRGDRRRP